MSPNQIFTMIPNQKKTKTITGGVMQKTVIKFSQYSQENTCVGEKKRLQHRSFPVNIAKFLRTPILKKICERLLFKGIG